MTTVDEYNLQRCEAVIERNMNAFVEVGMALLEIREQRYYKATHSTFASYCEERWGMKKSHAYRTIQASQFVRDQQQVSPIGDTLPNEHQARLAIQEQRNDDRELFIATPVDHTRFRCDIIMRELTSNPELARLVRIELMKWYALNT